MNSAPSTRKTKKPFFNKHCLVASGGAIFGLVFFTWISLMVVFYTTRYGDRIPYVMRSSDSALPITLSSFSSQFVLTKQVESYVWPREDSLVDYVAFLQEPALFPATAIPDWVQLYNWASSTRWFAQNTAKYDFQAQHQPVFWNLEREKPFHGLVPLPKFLSERSQDITLTQFFEDELGDSESETSSFKYKKFEGIVFRPSDNLQEFPQSPSQTDYKHDLVGKEVSLVIQSSSSRTQPFNCISGKLVLQAQGVTEWVLSPPSEAYKYQYYPYLHPLAIQSQLDFSIVSDAGLYGIRVNDLSQSADSSSQEEYIPIEVVHATLRAGKILFIPPLWTAHMVASMTSVTAELDLDLQHVATELKSLLKTDRVDLWGVELPDDPVEAIKIRVGLLADAVRHLLNHVDRTLDVAPKGWTEAWFTEFFASFERFHSQLASVRYDLAHSLIRDGCFDAPLAPPTKTIIPQLMTSMRMLDAFKTLPEKSLVLGWVLESASFALLGDPRAIHSFFHECQSSFLPQP